MKNNLLTSMLVIGLGMPVLLFLVVEVLTSQGNVLGAAYRYLLPLSFVFGLIAPKASVYLLMFYSAYIDLGKKVMIMDGNLFFSDLFFILGVPPVLLLGACVAKALALFFQWREPAVANLRKSFFIACGVIIIISTISLFGAGLRLATLKNLANSAAYYGFIFLLPSLYKEKSEVLKLVRFTVLLMIPAAAYGFYHFFVGMNDFELMYYSLGISTNDKYVLNGEGIFGPFASQGALSSTMCLVAVFCLMGFQLSKEELKSYLPKPICGVLVVYFLVAAIISLSRGPLLIFPCAIFLYLILRSKKLVALTLFVGIGGAACLAVYGTEIADRLPLWQSSLHRLVGVNSEKGELLFRINTLTVRLHEFHSLSNSENWKPFGTWFMGDAAEAKRHVHVGMVGYLVKLGYVPLLGVLLFLVPVAVVFLKIYQKLMRNGEKFGAACCCLGLSLIVVPLIGMGSLVVFPVPLYIGFCLSIFWLSQNFVAQDSVEGAVEEDVVVPRLGRSYAQ